MLARGTDKARPLGVSGRASLAEGLDQPRAQSELTRLRSALFG